MSARVTRPPLSNDRSIATTAYTDEAVAVEAGDRAAADALLAPLESPVLAGDPQAPTPSPVDDDGSIATTAFVQGAISDIPPTTWGTIAGTLSDQVDLQAALDLKAPLASPTFTGDPRAPTPAGSDNDTTISTTAYVTSAVAAEAVARAAADALLAPLASPSFTGNPSAPTPSPGDNDTSLATTAFVSTALTAYIRAFTAAGAVTNMRLFVGSATTDANGDWTVDMTAAGFGSAPRVWSQPLMNTSTVTDMLLPAVRTVSATSVAGTAVRGVVLLALGATMRRAAAGAVVYVVAIGT